MRQRSAARLHDLGNLDNEPFEFPFREIAPVLHLLSGFRLQRVTAVYTVQVRIFFFFFFFLFFNFRDGEHSQYIRVPGTVLHRIYRTVLYRVQKLKL